MKYLLIAAIIAALAFVVYWRLRPYIRIARRVLGVVREARAMSTGTPRAGQGTPDAPQPKRTVAGERLVRCDACGTWFPPSRAVTLRRTSSNFCSHACLERSAGARAAERAAGNQQ